MSKEQNKTLHPIVKGGLITITLLLIMTFEVITISNYEITTIIYLIGLSYIGTIVYKILKTGVNKIYARIKQNS